MTYEYQNGWFSEVNGVKVVKKDVGLSTTVYYDGHPRGVLWHYTAGCSGDIAGVLQARGISVTFSVGRDGVVYQYIPFTAAGWHAYGASHAYVGIEHAAYPGSCDLTDVELESSAALSAAIVEAVRKMNKFDIPLKKLTPPVGDACPPGFLDHRDGSGDWNKDGHTDHLYRWTWDKYLDEVRGWLEEDMRLDDLEQGSRDFRAGVSLNDNWNADRKFGWLLEKRIANAAAAEPSGSLPPHSHSGTVNVS